jgi:hypothetical protein
MSKMIELADIEKAKVASEKKTREKNARPRDEGATNDDATQADAIIEGEEEESVPKKRGDGIKKVKANLKRGGSDACMEALEKMMAKREVLEKAKEERYMAAIEVDKKLAEAKILKEEKDIMLADTSSLNPIQRAWLEKKQKMILEKME